MKRLKKINLSTVLQIAAVLVIFLFGYPGCSFKKDMKATVVNKDSPIISPGTVLT